MLLLAAAAVAAGCTAPEESTDEDDVPEPPTGGTPPTSNVTAPTGNVSDGGNETEPLGNETEGAVPTREIVVSEGFEGGAANWSRGEDRIAGTDFNWKAERSGAQAHSGDSSLRFTVSGADDSGSVWVVRAVDLGSDEAYAINLTVWAWSANDTSDGLADLLLYVGTTPPQDESSFEPENGGARHAANRAALDLTEGWRAYHLDWATPAPESGKLYVAVGISIALGDGAEFFVDDMRVTFTPLA